MNNILALQGLTVEKETNDVVGGSTHSVNCGGSSVSISC